MESGTVDIIQLENFATTMPHWDPQSKNQHYAVVDMGSNGIRFSVTSLEPPQTRLLRCLYRERAAISLFDALASSLTFQFSSQVINDVSQTLARFLRIAQAYNVPLAHISVFATEAMRKAKNSIEMLRSIHDMTGLKVHVLDGKVETLFGAAGARSAFTDVRGLFLDLGGGSVQMTWLDSETGLGTAGEGEGILSRDDEQRVENSGPHSVEPEGYEVAAARAGRSMPFGAARMISVLECEDEAIISSTKSDLHLQMYESFQTLKKEFPVLRTISERSTSSGNEDDGIDVYMCGGGFRGYGSMLIYAQSLGDTPYPINSIGSYKVLGTAFAKTKEIMELHEKTIDSKIFGLSKRRRRQFPAIIAVVEAFLAAVQPAKIRSVTFCTGSNREGALFMMLPREVREMKPLPLLAPMTSPASRDATESIIEILRSAMPQDLVPYRTPTIFSLGLICLFIQSLWSRPGGDSEYNAAAVLHEAISRDEVAGMTHVARAVLALTTAARWEVVKAKDLGPVEKQLWKGLKNMIGDESYFWCAFLGTVAMCICSIIPAWPQSSIQRIMRFATAIEHGKKKDKIYLTMQVNKEAAVGIDISNLSQAFEKMKMQKENEIQGRKVNFTIELM